MINLVKSCKLRWYIKKLLGLKCPFYYHWGRTLNTKYLGSYEIAGKHYDVYLPKYFDPIPTNYKNPYILVYNGPKEYDWMQVYDLNIQHGNIVIENARLLYCKYCKNLQL